MDQLKGKKILVGITGGIAAYKVCELVRVLRNAGAEVQIVMTTSAQKFVTPLSLEVLTGKPVFTDLFAPDFESNIGHIHLSRWPDIIMIAPASANCIARLAHGLADDLLTTLCLATHAPIAIVPAMNMHMWHNPATQENVASLKSRSMHLIGPDQGEQACGDNGFGRLVQPAELLAWLTNFFSNNKSPGIFAGKKILVTAGPTHEAIDPVRYISTLSSGTMGYVIAESMTKLGAEVILVSGPSRLSVSAPIKKIDVISAEQMHQAVINSLPCDIFIGAAAVSDYKPINSSLTKIKRNAETLTLNLVKNPDILAAVRQANPQAFMVGFAAETHQHLHYAKEKLDKKGVDIIVLNAVENGQGFGVNTENQVTLLTPDGMCYQLPRSNKSVIADHLAEFIAERINKLTSLEKIES